VVVKMYIILVYDVSVDRIDKIRRYLKQYLNWVQNSAFEGELREGEIEKIKAKLREIIDKKEDSIIIYKTHNPKWIKKEILGVEKSQITTII
jgi:CRISPR-associated protein Cas2